MLTKLCETQDAFDAVAADYDGPSGNNALIQRFRNRLHSAVLEVVASGSTLLDLGCGTGLDAEFFARLGYRVVAVDWAPAMVARTAARLARAGLLDQVEVVQLGAHQLDQLPGGSFDAVYSDLGPLNCAPGLAESARQLARVMRPGGKFVASVIGRVCPWEWAFFVIRGQWRRAVVRLSPDFVAVPLGEQTVWTHYYSPREFESIFAAAGFQRVSLRSLGLFVPPPYLCAFAERHPRLIRVLQAFDDGCGGWPVLNQWGDHFLLQMRRCAP